MTDSRQNFSPARREIYEPLAIRFRLSVFSRSSIFKRPRADAPSILRARRIFFSKTDSENQERRSNLMKHQKLGTFIFRFYSICLTCAILFSAFISAFAQTPPSQPLVLNQPLEGEVKGGEEKRYAVALGANQTARVEVVQKGIEIALAAYKPNGELFIVTNIPSGLFGNDFILVTAVEAGEYQVAVEGADPRVGLGKYAIKLAEIRPTVEEDFRINERAKQIFELSNATNPMRQLGTQEGRRQAIENYRQIVELSRLQKDKMWEIVALVQMGIIYEQLGELQKSLDAHETGLRLAREVGSRQWESGTLNNLGLGYKSLGDCEKAVFYLNQSFLIDRELGDKRGEAFTLNNLGGCYLALNDTPKAQDFFERALALHREVKNQRSEANSLNNLGQLFARIGDRAKAVEFFEQSLAVRRLIGDKAGEALPLQNLGRLSFTAGDNQKAFDYFNQSNQLARQVGDRRVEGNSLYWLARAEKERGNTAKAIENIENGLALVEQIRGEIISPDLRVAFFSTVQQFYELYTELLVARYEKSKDEADVALALQTSERARTRSLIELLQEAKIDFKQGVDGKSLEQAQDLQSKLNAKYRQRTTLLAGKNTTEQVAKITDEINVLTTEMDNLQTKIRRENPRYASLTSSHSLSAKEIQNLLDDETVLLEYQLGDARSFLWLVTKNQIKIHTLPARKDIEKLAKDFHAATAARDKSATVQTADLQKRLSEILIAPVAAQIENKRLAIVADGVLQFVPFAALQSPKSADRFLIESNEIVNLPSASVLPLLRENTPTRPANEKTVALFADAVFTVDDARLSAKKTAASAKPIEVKLNAPVTRIGLSRLPFSRREANAIMALAPKTETFSALDFAANREAVLKMDLKPFRIVHFATHGWLDAEHPQFSGIVLSLVNERGESLDGFLRLNEIYNLDLAADLVVLSACQTGLGKTVSSEGVIGLTRGFMYAGATRVMSSLWNVDDAATAELMRRFYQNLLKEKRPSAAALRAAQISLIKEKRWQNPYFWAAFSIQGEWR